MPQFYTLLTDTGQAKLANAVALGGTIEITELAVGDGNGSLPTPDSSAEALVNEVRRAAINTSTTDPDNPSWIVVEQVLPPDVGGWTIREIGIYDVDGDLIGIGNYPETYKPVLAEGSSRTQTVRFVLEVSDTRAVTLRVDPSVVLATREYSDAGDSALKAAIEQAIADAGYQFASYDPGRVYTTEEVVRGSDGRFYEFYDRDRAGTVAGIDPVLPSNRPHVWMLWDGTRPGATVEWRSETLPEGYIENDGATISRRAYRRVFGAFGTLYGVGDGSMTFAMPDDRGEFKRGLDRGRGMDPNRAINTGQDAQIRLPFAMRDMLYGFPDDTDSTVNNHSRSITVTDDWPLTPQGQNGSMAFDNSGKETRPRNIAVLYLTKI